MNNSAAKVGEIFREAGTAFNKLSEMTLMFQPTEDSPTGGKWSEEEVEMLRGCVNRFAVELNKISGHIKNRTMSQLRQLLEMDSGMIRNMQHEAVQPFQQQLQQQQNHEVYNLSWANNQILANGIPLNQQFDDLYNYLNLSTILESPVHQVENDIQPDLGAVEFDDGQYEFNCNVPDIIQLLGDIVIQPVRDDTSSQANFGTLHAVVAQNCGNPEPAAGGHWQQMNQNIVAFNIQENFNLDQLQHVFYQGAEAPVAEGGQNVIDPNILNTPPLSDQNISYDYPTFGLPFVQSFIRPDEKASALPAGSEIISPETQHRPPPEAAPAPQTGALTSIDRNNPYEKIHLKIDNNSIIYDEPDIKNVVFPGPFSPLNKYINNCNPDVRKASIEHDGRTQVTDETDPPANTFWKLKSSVRVPWEENLSSCDFVELFEQAKHVSRAKARSIIKQRLRDRPAESAQSRKKKRGSGGRKKVTVTTPGPVTRSQTRRLRKD